MGCDLDLYSDDDQCVSRRMTSLHYYGIEHPLSPSHSTFASSAPSSTSSYIVREFQIPAEVSYLLTTVFLLGYVFGVRLHFTLQK